MLYNTEKSILLAQLAEIERERMEKDKLISSLQDSLHRQNIFAAMPLSRWKISSATCILISYSNGFIDLTKHSIERLQSYFSYMELYSPEHQVPARKFFEFIYSGQAESFAAKVPILAATGKIVHVFAMLHIEYKNNIPTALCQCMKEYDSGGEGNITTVPIFEPFFIQTRTNAYAAEPLILNYADVNPYPSNNEAQQRYPQNLYNEHAAVPSGDHYPAASENINFYVPDVSTMISREEVFVPRSPVYNARNENFTQPNARINNEQFQGANAVPTNTQFDEFTQQFAAVPESVPTASSLRDSNFISVNTLDSFNLHSSGLIFDDILNEDFDRGKPLLKFGP